MAAGLGLVSGSCRFGVKVWKLQVFGRCLRGAATCSWAGAWHCGSCRFVGCT